MLVSRNGWKAFVEVPINMFRNTNQSFTLCVMTFLQILAWSDNVFLQQVVSEGENAVFYKSTRGKGMHTDIDVNTRLVCAQTYINQHIYCITEDEMEHFSFLRLFHSTPGDTAVRNRKSNMDDFAWNQWIPFPLPGHQKVRDVQLLYIKNI